MNTIAILVVHLFTTIAMAAPAAIPKSFDLSKEVTKVEFTAIGKPNFLKIDGTGGKATGIIEVNGKSVKANLQVKLQDVTTGIAKRDEHMKTKYLEVSKYPEATLTISELVIDKDPMTENFTQKAVPFKGKLTVHGEQSDIEGTADIQSTKTSIEVVAKTKTTITAHKIDLPSYMGIKVADQVEILAEIKLKK